MPRSIPPPMLHRLHRLSALARFLRFECRYSSTKKKPVVSCWERVQRRVTFVVCESEQFCYWLEVTKQNWCHFSSSKQERACSFKLAQREQTGPSVPVLTQLALRGTDSSHSADLLYSFSLLLRNQLHTSENYHVRPLVVSPRGSASVSSKQ